MPELTTIMRGAVPVLAPLLSLQVGLVLSPARFYEALQRPVVWRALGVCLLIVPAIAFGTALLIPLPPIAGGILVLHGVSLGPILLASKVRNDPARLETVATVAVLLMLLGLLALPAALGAVRALFPYDLQVSRGLLLRNVVLPVLIPLGVGMLVRAIDSTWAARLRGAVELLFKLALAVSLVTIGLIALRSLNRVHPNGVIAMVLVVTLSALAAHVLAGPDAEHKRIVVNAAVIGNPAVLLLVATNSYPGVEFAPAIATYLVVRALAYLPYGTLLRRRGGSLAARRHA